MSEPLTDSDLAAIEAALATMTPGLWVSKDNAMGAWIVCFEDDDATVDRIWFGDMESNTGRDIANANGIVLLRNHADALLSDLRATRQERDQAREESRQLRTDLANALLAHLIKNLNEMDEAPRFAFRATPNAQLFRKWLETAATTETPCEDCPTTPVQHCCNWHVDATKEERADGEWEDDDDDEGMCTHERSD